MPGLALLLIRFACATWSASVWRTVHQPCAPKVAVILCGVLYFIFQGRRLLTVMLIEGTVIDRLPTDWRSGPTSGSGHWWPLSVHGHVHTRGNLVVAARLA